jgi:hypothetical protein
MGAAVGAAVDGAVLWASEGRSEATAQRAATFTDAGSVTELVRSSDVILSICPPAAAEDVARQVFGAGFDGIFVEANAISPAKMRRIAELGVQVVDGSIIAVKGINLYLAGPRAEQVAALFPDGEVKAIVLPGEVGAASALKMAFGGWNTGSPSPPRRARLPPPTAWRTGSTRKAWPQTGCSGCATAPGAGRRRWRRSPTSAKSSGSPTASRGARPGSTAT